MISVVAIYIITILVRLHLLKMEGITSSEQITSPNDTKAILKHVSFYSKEMFITLVDTIYSKTIED